MSRRYYIAAPVVIVRGKPSSSLADRLEKESKARIVAQMNLLGAEGAAKREEELENAKSQNWTPIPEDVLASFAIPDVHTISWVPVLTSQGGDGLVPALGGMNEGNDLSQHIEADGTNLPFFVQFDHVQVRNY